MHRIIRYPQKKSSPATKSHTRQITLTISDADGDGHWVVSDSVSDMYGEGKDPTHALFDWLRSLDHDYRFLKKEKHRLGPGMVETLKRLEDLLGVR